LTGLKVVIACGLPPMGSRSPPVHDLDVDQGVRLRAAARIRQHGSLDAHEVDLAAGRHGARGPVDGDRPEDGVGAVVLDHVGWLGQVAPQGHLGGLAGSRQRGQRAAREQGRGEWPGAAAEIGT